MDDVLRRLSELWTPTGWVQIIDILVVAFVVYRLLKLVQGRRAWTLLMGIAVFVLVLFISERLQLRTLHWLLEKATILAPVALVILLLPELRAAIEGFARLGLWPERFLAGQASLGDQAILEVSQACRAMARESTGAIVVLERTESLADIAKTGVNLNAQVTSELLEAIFYEGNPLHDGAALIRQDTVMAAACRLPLSENPSLDGKFHMRHRAGLGISEATDGVVIIVSEETGRISIAVRGQIQTLANHDELEPRLKDLLVKESSKNGAKVFGRQRKEAARASEEAS